MVESLNQEKKNPLAARLGASLLKHVHAQSEVLRRFDELGKVRDAVLGHLADIDASHDKILKLLK